jgi:tetratricopeptide (TPR) repeat protein
MDVPTSPELWLGAGKAYFSAGDLDHAELALVEGNVLDTSNFYIRAYLTLTYLQAERHDEAEVSYQQALKCSPDSVLLTQIAQGFEKIGNFRYLSKEMHSRSYFKYHFTNQKLSGLCLVK